MLKRILIAALMWPLLALAQSYPSPTFNNLTVNGTFTSTGNIGLASLAAQAANTVVANATASSASPTAFVMPGCSATGNALNWTTNTGFACQTGLATLASPTFTGTPAAPTAATNTNTTQVATTAFVEGEFANPPSTGFGSTTARPISATTMSSTGATAFAGVTNGACAASGKIGECVNATVLVGSAIGLTSNTAMNITSVSLTAGNWLCYGDVAFVAGGTTVTSTEAGWISSVSATNPGAPNSGAYTGTASLPSTAGGNSNVYPVGVIMQNVTTTTTIYLEALGVFSTSTLSVYGYINCVRWH